MEELIIILLSSGGIATGLYIHHKRKTDEVMTCMIGETCNDVLESKYSKTILGIDNEIWGMIYFALIGIYYGTGYIYSSSPAYPLEGFVFALSLSGAAYSLFLIYVQAFVLKAWCEKCLVLALPSFIIPLLIALKLYAN